MKVFAFGIKKVVINIISRALVGTLIYKLEARSICRWIPKPRVV